MVSEDLHKPLYTDTQSPEVFANLSPAIAEALSELKAAFPNQSIEALYWNQDHVAIPFEVKVQLPSRGSVGGVDIRPVEPVFLLFSRNRYPYKAPSAYSNRQDFPKNQLPHLNPTEPGRAAWFCLHRGNIDAWFAEHGLRALVERIRFWLRDAGRGRLVPLNDVFEPTRMRDSLGQTIFEPATYLQIIKKHWHDTGGTAGFSMIGYELLDDQAQAELGLSGYSVRFNWPVSPEKYETFLKFAKLVNEMANEEAYKKLFKKKLFGVLVWAEENAINDRYFGELPNQLNLLIEWAKQQNLPLEESLQAYLENDLHLLAGIPVTVAIRRSKNIIGADGDIELLTFIVNAGGDYWPEGTQWNGEAKVFTSDHRKPLTINFARHLSSHDQEKALDKTVVFGCGALGSKVVMHFARSGQTTFTLVDPAKLSPHNVVRHALGGRRIGLAKAESLKEDITELYPGQDNLGLSVHEVDAIEFLFGEQRSGLDECKNLIDATASTQVFNMLVDANLPEDMAVSRMEIADKGRIGLLSMEGPSRNPRIDDLQALLFDASIHDTQLSQWLCKTKESREQQIGSGLEEIQIGLSCSSTTMRLSDEVVSFHAAAMSAQLRHYFTGESTNANNTNGGIFLSFFNENGTSIARTFDIAPVIVINARNNPKWQVRFTSKVIQEMREALRRARPRETGGLLIGMIHSKRRIIYVTRLLNAPNDSEGSPMAFFRGIHHLPEEVFAIEERSGGLIGYVGEWHTHPAGGPNLSHTDLQAVQNLKHSLDKIPMPTQVVIVTSRGIYPHVFEPGGSK